MNTQRLRQLVQCPQRQILLRPLDRSDVSAVKIALRRKLLLRPPALLAQPANDDGDDMDRPSTLHSPQDADMMRIALQGIASISIGTAGREQPCDDSMARLRYWSLL
jgi:hypothetical protein